ncbi:MAG: Clp domain protein [Modestobacter sp.]|nr:Clp domain protein [Modestobacter sp.]
MFGRFTDEARQAVNAAQGEARRLRAPRIEPVHLLLALSAEPGRAGRLLRDAGIDHDRLQAAVVRSGPLDADALAAVGIDLDQVRAATEAAFGPGALDRGRPRATGPIFFADASRQALAQTVGLVGRRHLGRIDAGHVLFGVLAVADPLVGRLLQQLGTDPDSLREGAAGTDAA